jgi:hypothetical protein
MQEALLDFGIGAIIGGLSLSACWGLFWLAVGTVGFSRGTCSWRVLLNSLVVGVVPLMLVSALLWMRGAPLRPSLAFAAGLSVMPLALLVFGLRSAPDGRRAGTHMLEGARHLIDELLGKHHECGGCGHNHGDETTPRKINVAKELSPEGEKILSRAEEECYRIGNDYLGTEHLVLGIALEPESGAYVLLRKMGLHIGSIRSEIEINLPGGGTTMFGKPPLSPRVKTVLRYAGEEAGLLGCSEISSQHLLLGLLREEEGIGGKVLRSFGANLESTRMLSNP